MTATLRNLGEDMQRRVGAPAEVSLAAFPRVR